MRIRHIIALAVPALLAIFPAGARAAATNAAYALSFSVGEELVYRLYWGVIPVGFTRVTTRWVSEGARTNIAIRYQTESNKVLEKVYPVSDVLESVIDPDGFLPIRFTKQLNEGRYHVNEVTTFDHTNRMAHWVSKLKNKQRDFPIEADTRDIICLTYHLRSVRFTPGQRAHYRVMADEKLYDVYISARAVETLSLSGFGEVRCLKVEPEAAFEGLFLRKGRVWFWIAEDKRRICTKLVGSVPVANIKAVLIEVRGPGDDRWTRATRAKAGAGGDE